tara:strand:+ start:890 stop:1297 length:408 start_codon:yes stop_codon:yes gene_type:complete
MPFKFDTTVSSPPPEACINETLDKISLTLYPHSAQICPDIFSLSNVTFTLVWFDQIRVGSFRFVLHQNVAHVIYKPRLEFVRLYSLSSLLSDFLGYLRSTFDDPNLQISIYYVDTSQSSSALPLPQLSGISFNKL